LKKTKNTRDVAKPGLASGFIMDPQQILNGL